MRRVAQLPNPGSTAPAEGVFLDALEAFAANEYRTALLYSAVALEIAASTSLDSACKAATSADGESDPVYERLREGRTSFQDLLHVRPLYLRKRSLLFEDKELYDRAVCLYRTRNDIAHTGVSGNKGWPLDAKHTRRGLETARDVFKWLGTASDFEIPPEAHMKPFDPAEHLPAVRSR